MGGDGLLGNERGFTLIIVLVMVVILGLTAGIAGSTWKTVMQREREEELLWRGDQYRRAIASYYGAQKSGGTQMYPNNLRDLLRDPRSLETVRHIRRLYADPMTGEDFVLVKDPGGRIKGVHSASTEEPFKKDGFPKDYEDFVDVEKYSEWLFVYEPPKPKTPSTTTTSGGTGAGGPVGPGPAPGPSPGPGPSLGGSIQSLPEMPPGWTPLDRPGTGQQ